VKDSLLASLGRVAGVASVACAVAASACGDTSSGKAPAGERGGGARNDGLAGEWRWVASEQDGRVTRPGGAADSAVIEIGAWGAYREYTHGSTLQGHYRMGQGRMYRLDDSAYVVLVLDSSRFFPPSGSPTPSVAVRALGGDSLVLSGTGSDTSFYTFVRVVGAR
jgi:hypothetical protein